MGYERLAVTALATGASAIPVVGPALGAAIGLLSGPLTQALSTIGVGTKSSRDIWSAFLAAGSPVAEMQNFLGNPIAAQVVTDGQAGVNWLRGQLATGGGLPAPNPFTSPGGVFGAVFKAVTYGSQGPTRSSGLGQSSGRRVRARRAPAHAASKHRHARR